MPRWLERRGFTLQLPPERGADAGPDDGSAFEKLVRLSLVERVGLVRGWFNVREARAEPTGNGERLRALSDGRALSWRWLRRTEADRLLDERLGTLQAMGYTVIDTGVCMRGRWDWLYDLVHKRLAQAPAAEPSEPSGNPLEDTLSRIGSSPDAIVESLAAVFELSPHAFNHPDARVVHRIEPGDLARLLPYLIHHDHAEVRAIGRRWLGCPTAAYQLPAELVQRWLETDEALASLLEGRLRPEGLALLGPDSLLRLSRTGCTHTVRDASRRWVQRLG